jgi:chaperonin GroEL
MNPKKVYIGDEGKDRLREGIKLFSAAVKSTLGPSGKYVLVEDSQIIGGFSTTKDGITVAKAIRFEDPVMDMAANMMRQASERTSKNVGDGTTTSVVLTEAILDAFDRLYDPSCGLSIVDVTRGLEKIKNDILAELDKAALKVTSKEMLKHVATISTNNDPELGELVAEVMHGVDNAIVEMHGLATTKVETIRGLTLGRGWTSPYFANDSRRRECILDNPYVLICDREIPHVNAISEMLAAHFLYVPKVQEVPQGHPKYVEPREGKPILIIAPVASEALEALAYNASKKMLKVCVVAPPSFGEDSKDRMRDLAQVLGGTYFSKDVGDDFQMVTFESLGRARKVTVTDENTIIEPLVEQEEEIESLVSYLTGLKEDADETELKRIEGRIQAVCGAYGVITVGAATPIELKEKKDRIDDAVCAVRAAKKEGVLPGGGVALIDSFGLIGAGNQGIDYRIMSKSLEAPLRQMLLNAGKADAEAIMCSIHELPHGHGMNIKTGETGDMIEMGIIDPLSAVKNAIENAVSVASTILNTECVVSHIRQTE